VSAERDTTRIVRSWLRTDEHESANRVLDDVLALLDATPQRRSTWPTRRIADMNSYLKLAFAAAAVVVVAVVGYKLSESLGVSGIGNDDPPTATSTQPSPSLAATPRSEPTDTLDHGRIDRGGYDIPWPLGPSDARIHLTVPAGWAWIGSGMTTIYKDEGRFYDFPVDLAAHSVSRVVSSVCAADESSAEVGPSLVDVGPTVDDLTTAITNVVGTHWSAPMDVTLGGYPAKSLVVTYSSADCPGPTRRWIWLSDTGEFFVQDGVTSTIYVVDVDGDRLVITTNERRASPDNIAELEAIVASVDIERQAASGRTPTPRPAPTAPGLFPVSMGPDGDLRIGRHAAIVEDIPFSFSVPTSGWEPQLSFYISKSSKGAQGAEATVRWTSFPNGFHTDPCPGMLTFVLRPSAADLADAVADAPGVDVVTGPSDVSVGGRAAKHVVLSVREDVGCDPGFFYTYEAVIGGALWTDTQPGDTIMVWIVDVDGALLFIEGETKTDAGSVVEQEIQQIVDSMRFE
jgi:hypothetical protein